MTVPQFRALIFLNQHEDATLSALAEHVGLSLPATSRMVQCLVKRGLLERQPLLSDRRYVSLSLTRRGVETFQAALAATEVALARTLKALPAEELASISAATRSLIRVFAPNGQGPGEVK
ncbi:MAG: hypothetical protein AMXMBFR13_16510 [Phycisphaerae bacterium]